jgi:hypothetical protein
VGTSAEQAMPDAHTPRMKPTTTQTVESLSSTERSAQIFTASTSRWRRPLVDHCLS